MGFLKLLNVQGIAGIVVGVALAVMLALQVGKTHDAKVESAKWELAYNREHTAYQQTTINYQNAANKARQLDAENKARVWREEGAISQKRDTSYEARISAARARAGSLQHNAKAGSHPGSSGTAPVPGLPAPPGGPNGPTAEAGLPPDDALIATEQAIQLDELQRWVDEVSRIDVDGQ